jgi:streptothricin hydrolase
VVHVQNDGRPGEPDEPGTDGWQLVFPASADELIVRKDQYAFAANPALARELADKQITEVVIAGMQGNYCVAESSRGALKQGLQAILALGAHATYDGEGALSARCSWLAAPAKVSRRLEAFGMPPPESEV